MQTSSRVLFLLPLLGLVVTASSRDEFTTERANLQAALGQVNVNVAQSLLDLHPELKTKLAKFASLIPQCYDQSIDENVSVNIFEDKIDTVVKRYFVSKTLQL
mgnify:CR=1 FL=1